MVSLELRRTAITELADVVFPVAAVAEKAGAFRNWEGRLGTFDATVTGKNVLDDGRVLDTLGVEMDVDLYTQTPVVSMAEMNRLGLYEGDRPTMPSLSGNVTRRGIALASWRMNLDGGALQDGEPFLAGTAKADVARVSPATAARLSLADGGSVNVTTRWGAIRLPLAVTEMVDEVVWLPGRAGDETLTESLRARHGDTVKVHADLVAGVPAGEGGV